MFPLGLNLDQSAFCQQRQCRRCPGSSSVALPAASHTGSVGCPERTALGAFRSGSVSRVGFTSYGSVGGQGSPHLQCGCLPEGKAAWPQCRARWVLMCLPGNEPPPTFACFSLADTKRLTQFRGQGGADPTGTLAGQQG